MALDLPQLPTPQTGTRNLQLESGDPFALLRVGQQQAQSVAESTPEQKFGYALLQLLQQHQQLGTAPFVRQELNAREAQVNASNAALTNPSLQGYSPSTIFSSGRAAEAPYNPTIRGAQEGMQTFGEQIRGFGEGIKSARDYLNQVQQEQNRQRDDARSVIQNALTMVGGDAFHNLDPNEVNQLEKQAGYPKGYIHGVNATLRERELELKRNRSSKDQNKQNLLNTLGSQLQATRGQDGYVDPDKYLSLLGQFSSQTSDPQLFENTYLGLVNPKDRARVSGKVPTINSSQSELSAILKKYNIKNLNDLTPKVIRSMPLDELMILQKATQ